MNPQQKTKKKKFVKGQKNVHLRFSRGKSGKHHCSVCGKLMHGMPHGKTTVQVKKLSKSQRRPEALLAGTLCNICRVRIMEAAIQVKYGMKEMTTIDLFLKPLVEKAVAQVE